MTRRIHGIVVGGLALAAASAALADIAPLPSYVAGLWFETPRVYSAPAHPTQGPPVLYGCQNSHPNCVAATRAGVIGAIVASVNGVAGVDPRTVFAQPNAPGRIVIVFKRYTAANTPTYMSVTFAPR